MSSQEFKVVNLADFDPKKVVFGKAKPSKSGSGMMIPISYEGARLYLRMPKLKTPFGLSPTFNKDGYNLQLSFPSEESELGKTLLSKFNEFDQLMIQAAQKAYEAWGLNMSKLEEGEDADVYVRKLANKTVKYTMQKGKDGKKTNKRNTDFPGHMIAQIPMSGERGSSANGRSFTTEFYDSKGNPMTILPNVTDDGKFDKIPDGVPPQSDCATLLSVSGWANATTGYGATWRTTQMRVYPRNDLPRGQCMIQDDENDSDDEGAPAAPKGCALGDEAPSESSEQKEEQAPTESAPPKRNFLRRSNA